MPPSKKAPAVPKLKFASVAVVVSDRKRSLEWYTKNLGLEAVDENDHWVTVGRAGTPAVLHLCQTSEYDPSLPAEKGNTGIRFEVPGDFTASCARLAANGVKFSHPAEKTEWGSFATIEDPDGNEFTLTPAE